MTVGVYLKKKGVRKSALNPHKVFAHVDPKRIEVSKLNRNEHFKEIYNTHESNIGRRSKSPNDTTHASTAGTPERSYHN
jgi:hypothetical protein